VGQVAEISQDVGLLSDVRGLEKGRSKVRTDFAGDSPPERKANQDVFPERLRVIRKGTPIQRQRISITVRGERKGEGDYGMKGNNGEQTLGGGPAYDD